VLLVLREVFKFYYVEYVTNDLLLRLGNTLAMIEGMDCVMLYQ